MLPLPHQGGNLTSLLHHRTRPCVSGDRMTNGMNDRLTDSMSATSREVKERAESTAVPSAVPFRSEEIQSIGTTSATRERVTQS